MKLKDIKFGDCFAYKIKNDEELKGRYFILCSRNVRNEDKIDHLMSYFFLKITNDDKLPKTEEEINNLENVIVFCHEKEMFFGNMTPEEVKKKENIVITPDENGYLYMYTFYTRMTRKKYLKDLIYLGNFNIEYPEEEYVLPNGGGTMLISMDIFEENAAKRYKGNNWKRFKYWHQTKEQRQANADFWTKIKKKIDEIHNQE